MGPGAGVGGEVSPELFPAGGHEGTLGTPSNNENIHHAEKKRGIYNTLKWGKAHLRVRYIELARIVRNTRIVRNNEVRRQEEI